MSRSPPDAASGRPSMLRAVRRAIGAVAAGGILLWLAQWWSRLQSDFWVMLIAMMQPSR